jgi:hypothetical protein
VISLLAAAENPLVIKLSKNSIFMNLLLKF